MTDFAKFLIWVSLCQRSCSGSESQQGTCMPTRLMLFAVCAVLASGASAQTKWVPLKKIKAGTGNEPVETPKKAPLPAVGTTPATAEASLLPVARVPVASPAAQTAPVVSSMTGTQLPLQITCFGGGTANKAAVATAYSSGSIFGTVGTTGFSGMTSGTTTVVGKRQQGFDDQVDVRLFSGDDRIRLPRTILPPIHGGQAGWFKLKNVVADARSIRASAAINFMSNPKVYIDRVTGTISISGRAGDYTGQCQAFEAGAAPKF